MTSRSRRWYFTRKQFSERKNRETEDEESRKIYVGGLNDQTRKRTVKRYFKQFGVVLKCEIKKRYGNREAYGFVTFRDTLMVDDAQDNRPHEIDGKIVVTRRCVPQKNVGKPEAFMQVNKLFVGALRGYIWEIDLRKYFSEYGTIVNIKTFRDERVKKGRFLIMEFDDYDPVDKIQFGTHFIKGHQVEVKKALPIKEMKIAERKRDSGRVVVAQSRRRGGFDRNADPYGDQK